MALLTPWSLRHRGGGVAVTGTPAVGQTLTCSAPAGATFQWLRDSAAIDDATDETYTVQNADQGAALTCRVTIGSNELDVPAPPPGNLPAELLADAPWGYWRGDGYAAGTNNSLMTDHSADGTHTLKVFTAGGASTGYPKPGSSLIPTDPASVSIDFVPDSNMWDPANWIAAFDDPQGWSGHSWVFFARVKPRAGALTGVDRYVFGTDLWGVRIHWTGTKHVFQAYVTRQDTAYVATGSTAIVAGTEYTITGAYGQHGNTPSPPLSDAPSTFIALYVNGVQEAILDNLGSGEFDIPNRHPAMAQYSDAASGYDGQVGEPALYNHYVTPERILAWHAAVNGWLL